MHIPSRLKRKPAYQNCCVWYLLAYCCWFTGNNDSYRSPRITNTPYILLLYLTNTLASLVPRLLPPMPHGEEPGYEATHLPSRLQLFWHEYTPTYVTITRNIPKWKMPMDACRPGHLILANTQVWGSTRFHPRTTDVCAVDQPSTGSQV